MSDEIRVYVINDTHRNMLRLKYTCPQTGTVHRKSAKTNNPIEAQKAAGAWEAELRAGIKSKTKGRMTWKEFITICTKERIAALGESSRPIYAAILDSITTIVHPATVGSLTAQGVSKWQTHQREAGTAEATIESRSAALLAMLNWAKKQKYIAEVPEFAKIVRSRSGKKMKGRPLKDAEFQAMLKVTQSVVGGEKYVPGWHRSLKGLWLSGLRLSEAIDLSWDEPGRIQVDTTEDVPCLRIPGEKEKGTEDRLLPLTPDFGMWLLETPQAERTGPVFHFPRQRQRLSRKDPNRVSMLWVSHVISAIGEKAGIVVNQKPLKYASAHDFRRTFGERWRRECEPQVLMELMRHADLQTTMDYYSEHNSRRTGIDLWKKFGGQGPTLGPSQPKPDDQT